MSTTVILCEKPSAAGKVASALGGRSVKKVGTRTYWYEFTDGKNKIIVVPSVGHVFSLKQKQKGWNYPVFDVEWVPTWEVEKNATYMKAYVANLRKAAKIADSVIVATDYDIEGEVIAWNILTHVFKKKTAQRMKFSTLTAPDLREAYDHVLKKIELGRVDAGLARHMMDWFWGINTSRALMSAVKSQNRFAVLSMGRVQGPALSIVVKREREIEAFKSKPYWELSAIIEGVKAIYEKGKLWEKPKAETLLNECKGKDALITDVIEKQQTKQPHPPFNLSDLQREAYRWLHISPAALLKIAQNLYSEGAISYPRTSSQKVPANLDVSAIVEKLKKEYPEIARNKLAKRPKEGSKTDPAHPAIYPTGESLKSSDEKGKKVYDLIVRRFLAAMGRPAIIARTKVHAEIDTHTFLMAGAQTKEKGWMDLYAPYVKQPNDLLPPFKKEEKYTPESVTLEEKETQPPARYNPTSLITELEKRNLGTKSTRATIIESLYYRKYIHGQALEATPLGIAVISALEKNCPEIVSDALTREFEKDMEEIQENRKEAKHVLNAAQDALKKILEHFKKEESDIGKLLLNSIDQTQKEENEVGTCSKCAKPLRIIVSKRTGKRFVGCSGYASGCRNAFPLPQSGGVRTTKNICKTCDHPIVIIIRKGKRPWNLCINMACPDKKQLKKR